MYGAAGYGRRPYGSSGGVTAFDFAAMLASSREELIVTCEITIWPIGGSAESKIYIASAEWASSPNDVPASTPFDGRLTTFQWSRSIVGDRIGIDFRSGDVTIAFANPDGAFDSYLNDYTIDGRSIVVRIGRKTDLLTRHFVLFRGVGVDWSADNDAVTVTARDKSFLLDMPAQPNVYAGTGGAEGGDDLTGKRKPLVLGYVGGAPPVMIDSANLIYQVHDGNINSLGAVFDRGVMLSSLGSAANTSYALLVAAAVTAGYYKYSREVGMFKLGASASGIVLLKAEHVNDESAAEAILYLIDHAGALSDDEIDQASFDVVAVTFDDGGIARYIGPDDSSSVSDVIRGLMAGKGGWAGFGRDGRLSIGILTAPSGSPVASFDRDEGDIIDLRREALPSGVWPPPWRWRVAWGINETVFTDFAGSVTEANKDFFATPYRLAEAKNLTILDDYRAAQDPPPVEANFTDEADAQAEADRLLALYSSGYKLYRMTLGRRALALNLGDAIFVTWPRFGLDAGRLLRVVGVEDRIDLSDGSGVETVEVMAFG